MEGFEAGGDVVWVGVLGVVVVVVVGGVLGVEEEGVVWRGGVRGVVVELRDCYEVCGGGVVLWPG